MFSYWSEMMHEEIAAWWHRAIAQFFSPPVVVSLSSFVEAQCLNRINQQRISWNALLRVSICMWYGFIMSRGIHLKCRRPPIWKWSPFVGWRRQTRGSEILLSPLHAGLWTPMQHVGLSPPFCRQAAKVRAFICFLPFIMIAPRGLNVVGLILHERLRKNIYPDL